MVLEKAISVNALKQSLPIYLVSGVQTVFTQTFSNSLRLKVIKRSEIWKQSCKKQTKGKKNAVYGDKMQLVLNRSEVNPANPTLRYKLQQNK